MSFHEVVNLLTVCPLGIYFLYDIVEKWITTLHYRWEESFNLWHKLKRGWWIMFPLAKIRYSKNWFSEFFMCSETPQRLATTHRSLHYINSSIHTTSSCISLNPGSCQSKHSDFADKICGRNYMITKHRIAKRSLGCNKISIWWLSCILGIFSTYSLNKVNPIMFKWYNWSG